MGAAGNTILGMDRLLFGVIIGTAVFLFSMGSDWYLRKINQEQIVFKYQKVIIPLTQLVIASIIAYLLLKIYGVN